MAPRPPRAIGCCVLVLIAWLAALSWPDATWARTWTDLKGNKVDAEYVRITGEVVVLKSGPKMVKVPLAQLSPQDRAYVQEQAGVEGRHIWTDAQGRQSTARLMRVERGQVVLKAGDKTVSLPFSQLPYVDQQFVKQWLAERDQLDLLPKPDEDSRVWTDARGHKVMARLESVESGGKLKLKSYGIEIFLEFESLSTADQERLRSELKAARREWVLLKDPPPIEVAAEPTAAPPRRVFAPSTLPVPTNPPPQPSAQVKQNKVCPKCGGKLGPGTENCKACAAAAKSRSIAKSPPPSKVERATPQSESSLRTYPTAYFIGLICGAVILLGLSAYSGHYLFRWIRSRQ